MARPTKPTKIKQAQGTLQKCRTNPNEPHPETKIPPVPKWLDREASKEWRRAGVILEGMGLLSEMDLAAFAGYCTSVSDLIRCEEIIQAEGVMATVTMTNGGGDRKVKHPAFAMKHQALKTIKQFMTEFGMSPASRPRVHAEPREDEDDRIISKYLIN